MPRRRCECAAAGALTLALVFFFTCPPIAATARVQAERTDAAARRSAARALIDRNDFEGALAELAQAATLAQAAGDRLEEGRALTLRGLVFFNQADWPRMEEAYGSAIAALGDAAAFREQAAAMRALTFSPRLPFEEREHRVEQAIEVLAREPDDTTEGLLLHHWGDILFSQGRYRLAIEKLRLARPRLQASKDRSALARLLTSLGRAYRVHGQVDDAMAHYRQALHIQAELGDISGAAQSENAVMVALHAIGRHREAIRHARRALALATRAGRPAPIAFQRMNLASSYLRVGDPRRALPLLEPDPALQGPDNTVRLQTLSAAHRMLGHRDAAVDLAEQAVAAARPLGDPHKVAYALGVRASSRLAAGQLDAAYDDVATALRTVEALRQNLSTEDRLRQNFTDANSEFVTAAIDILTRLGRHAEALDVAEQARGRALLDLLASRDLVSAVAPGARDAERQRLIAEPPLSHDAMRAALAGLHSTLLAYWVAPDAAYVWVIDRDGVVHGRRIALTAPRLKALIDAMSRAGEQPTDSTKADASRLLYDRLIAPVERWLPRGDGSRLTIVPHGPLFALPFAALRAAGGRYLVERYAAHYITSLSVLAQTTKRRTGAAAVGALLVADPAANRTVAAREHLAPLPGARAEVAAIAHRLRPQPVTQLIGAAATRSAVRAAAAAARILHFATHAVVSDAGPLESFLALAGGPGDDGRLTSAEIYEWRLDADLVVLSACRTARGRVSGDGVIGLSRAFAYAGAPSLLATVWDAPDETAARLLPAFYTAWRNSGDRADALRHAQLEMIRSLRAGTVVVQTPAGPVTLHERPALWAPFVLLGAP